MTEEKQRNCNECKYYHTETDAAGFSLGFCRKASGLVVGSSDYLAGTSIAGACKDFEKDERRLKWELRPDTK